MAISRQPFGLQFSVDPSDPKDISIAKFGLDDKALERAQRRAVNKTAKWFRTRILRELAPLIGIQQKVLSNRFRLSDASSKHKSRGVNRTKTAYLWFGTKMIDAMALAGQGEAVGAGYMKGSNNWFWDGGFRAFHKSRQSHEGVFARKGNKRLPIVRQGIEIHDHVERLLIRLIRRGDKELLKKLKQELNYEAQKVLGKA